MKFWGYLLALGILMSALVAGVTIHASKNTPSVQTTKFRFKTDVYNYGIAHQHEVLSHTFMLQNRLSKPIHIAATHTTCSCTLVKNDVLGKIILTGETAAIPVSFDTGIKEGEADATVTVYCRYEDNPKQTQFFEAQAMIRGMVAPEFEVIPQIIDFGTVSPGIKIAKTLEIYPGTARNYRITKVGIRCPPFVATLKPVTNFPSRREPLARIAVDFTAPPLTHHETYNAVLRFWSTSEFLPVGKIVVRAVVAPDIEVEPSVVVLSDGVRNGFSRIRLLSRYPAQITRASDDLGHELKLEDADSLPLREGWANEYMYIASNSICFAAKSLNFELRVRGDSGRIEGRSASVKIKLLN